MSTPTMHAGLPALGVVQAQLRTLATAWPLLKGGVVPPRSGVRVRTARVDAPLPGNDAVMSGRVAVEQFALTYHGVLVHAGRRARDRAGCPTVAGLTWAPLAVRDTASALVSVTAGAPLLLRHPSAPVAWGFVTEVASLASHVAWVIPRESRWVPIGVPCVECAGEYLVEVRERVDVDPERRRVAFSGSSARAVCSANPTHVLGAVEVVHAAVEG